MSARSRNFANFEFGDNPLELSDGLLPKIAQEIEFPLPLANNPDNLGQFVGFLGKNAVLRENPVQGSVSISQAAEWVKRSGIMSPLDRELWRPGVTAPRDSMLVMTGGVANWMDRTEELLLGKNGFFGVIMAMGNRVMKSATELRNPRVQEFVENNHGTLPTEAQYAKTFLLPNLSKRYQIALFQSFDTSSGDELAKLFAEANQVWLKKGRPLTFARVSTAGVQLALQMRGAIRAQYTNYDNENDPKIGIMTDTIGIAQTVEEIENSRRFQSPYTTLRQIAVTAKLQHEATL